MDKQVSDIDAKLYPVLTYAAGPGHYAYERDQHPKDTVQPSTVPKTWGNHGGEDVALFATGPLSSLLFSGTVDQTYISQAIAYALCISIHSERCSVIPPEFEQLAKLSLTEQNLRSSDNEIIDGSRISVSSNLTDTDSVNATIIVNEAFNQSTNAQPLSDNSSKLCNVRVSVIVFIQILFSLFIL